MRRPLVLLLALIAATPAKPDGFEGAVQTENSGVRTIRGPRSALGCRCEVPARLTNRTPDYVGSVVGLSKPSYYGTYVPDFGTRLPRW